MRKIETLVETAKLAAPARRLLAVTAAAALLVLALARLETLSGGQAAVPLSLPGHEDLSFWVNHDGLIEVDVEGPVGFGDMGRLLMRRRSNSTAIRALRDRFTFRVRDFAALKAPDLFRVAITGAGLEWRNTPKSIVLGAGRIFNLPVVVVNESGKQQEFRMAAGPSSFLSSIGAKEAAGYFLKIVEPSPGKASRRLKITSGERALETGISVDVRALARLRVQLVDEDNSPTAARVYLTAADGLGYAPQGYINRFAALPAEQYFHVNGSFEIELPAGRTLIEATRGQEYRLASMEANLKPGETTDVRLELVRWTNMAEQGWYSADAHIHANYTAPHHQVITPEDVRLQTLAEDLNNANLMVANSGSDFLHDEALFEGKPHRLSLPAYLMYWNEEMRNRGIYGHMSFFNLKSLVHPIYTGFEDTPHWEDFPPNYAQAKGARGQGGAVTYVHPGYEATFAGASARELPVDLALGEIDAIDVISNNPEEVAMELWYRLLNCGFRLAISAGTDAFTNVADHYILGGGRVYVKLDSAMNYPEWIRNYKGGRSFASNGPVISFTLDGKEPGDELNFPDEAPQKLRVKATVSTPFPLDTVDVVVNGEAVITRRGGRSGKITIDDTLTLEKSSWVAVRAVGPWSRLILNDTGAFAHTSPVYVQFAGQPLRSAEDLRFYIDWIDQLIERVEGRGRFATAERRGEVVELFRKAQEVYRQRLN